MSGLECQLHCLYNGFHEINVNSPSSSACRNNRAKFKLGVSLGRISVCSASSFRPVSNVDLLWRYFSSSLDNGGKLFLQLGGAGQGLHHQLPIRSHMSDLTKVEGHYSWRRALPGWNHQFCILTTQIFLTSYNIFLWHDFNLHFFCFVVSLNGKKWHNVM